MSSSSREEPNHLCADAGTPAPHSPVAWRVKDFADGWVIFGNKAHAEAQAKMTGGLMEPLYRLTPTDCEPMDPDEEGWSEWVHPLPGYRMQCCDCGLIHDMEFVIGQRIGDGPLNEGESEDGVILFRARRSEAADGAPSRPPVIEDDNPGRNK